MTDAHSTDSISKKVSLDEALKAVGKLLETYEPSKQEEISAAFQDVVDRRMLAKAMPPVWFDALVPSWQGGKNTNTEARAITAAARQWAEKHLPGHSINDALEAIERLFSMAWTEIDESLHSLSSFKGVIKERAPDLLVPRPGDGYFQFKDGPKLTGLDTAFLMLHRWQDRGGAIGNIAQPGRALHPITELVMLKKTVRQFFEKLVGLEDEVPSYSGQVDAVLLALWRKLPEDSTERQLIDALLTLNTAMVERLENTLQEIRDINPDETDNDLPASLPTIDKAKECEKRIDRVMGCFHPMSDQFAALQYVKWTINGLDPLTGAPLLEAEVLQAA